MRILRSFILIVATLLSAAPMSHAKSEYGAAKENLAVSVHFRRRGDAVLESVFKLKNVGQQALTLRTGHACSGNSGFGVKLRSGSTVVSKRVFNSKTGMLSGSAQSKACPTDAPVLKTLAPGQVATVSLRETYTYAQMKQTLATGNIDSFQGFARVGIGASGPPITLFVDFDSFP